MEERPRKRSRQSAIHARTLVSCQRCRNKKIRCDEATPRCAACVRVDAQCLLVDVQSGLSLSRDELHEMERKLESLESSLRSNEGPVAMPTTSPTVGNESIPRFVGEHSNIGFVRNVMFTIRERMRPIAMDAAHIRRGHSDFTEHPLPSAEDAWTMINAYRRGFGSEHPFLSSVDIKTLYDEYYTDQPQRVSDQPQIQHGKFHLNMVFALAAVDLHRSGLLDRHPIGYFLAAVHSTSDNLQFSSVQDIQGFLLLAGFGQYFSTGCSIWELGQICVRMCFELGLHRPSRKALDPALEQTRRIVFWECYQLDRMTSSTLGRPYGIQDTDIALDAPVADHSTCHEFSWSRSGEQGSSLAVEWSATMRVWTARLELSQIGSKIRHTFYSRTATPSENASIDTANTERNTATFTADSYHYFENFERELQAWKKTIPIIQDPESVFLSKEWLHLVCALEKFGLARAAMDSTQTKYNAPPKELLEYCQCNALEVIQLYDCIKDKNSVVCSWHWYQQIFGCGVSMIFCCLIHVDPRVHNNFTKHTQGRQSLFAYMLHGEPLPSLSNKDLLAAVDLCADLLTWMSSHMLETARFTTFFRSMRHELHHIVDCDLSIPVPRPQPTFQVPIVSVEDSTDACSGSTAFQSSSAPISGDSADHYAELNEASQMFDFDSILEDISDQERILTGTLPNISLTSDDMATWPLSWASMFEQNEVGSGAWALE